jgi:hypothetical protein
MSSPLHPWSNLQLAYFVGTAMWTYLTQPFSFSLIALTTTDVLETMPGA